MYKLRWLTSCVNQWTNRINSSQIWLSASNLSVKEIHHYPTANCNFQKETVTIKKIRESKYYGICRTYIDTHKCTKQNSDRPLTKSEQFKIASVTKKNPPFSYVGSSSKKYSENQYYKNNKKHKNDWPDNGTPRETTLGGRPQWAVPSCSWFQLPHVFTEIFHAKSASIHGRES